METKQTHYAFAIMLSCCAIMTTGIGINNSCVGIFLSPVAQEFGVGMGKMSFYMTLRSLAMMLAIPAAGKLMQKYNVRIVLTAAFTVQCGSLAALGFCDSLSLFYFFGALAGVATAFIAYLPVPLLLNNWFQKNVGSVMGIAMSFSGLGAVVFNPVGNFFITHYGWRAGFFALGVVGYLIVLPFTALVIRRDPAEKGLRPYGADDSVEAEELLREGLTAKEAFRTPSFGMVLMFGVGVNFAGALLGHIPALAQSYGFDSNTAALSVSVLTAGVVVGKILVGNVNDRVGIGGTSTAAIAVGLLGIGALLLCRGNLALLFAGVALLGVTLAMPTLGPPLAISTLFGNLEYTGIYSTLSIATTLATSIGMSLYGFVYDLTGSYAGSLYIVAVALALAVVSIWLALRMGKGLTFHTEEGVAP